MILLVIKLMIIHECFSEKSKKPQNNKANDESESPKERCLSPEKRQQIIDELRLV